MARWLGSVGLGADCRGTHRFAAMAARKALAQRQAVRDSARMDPGEPRETTKLAFPDAVRVAVELHRQRRLDEAEGIYRRLLEIAPNDVDLRHYLGVLLAQRGDLVGAEASIRLAIERAPDYVAAHNNLGNILCQQKRFAEAEAQYRRVLALLPGDAAAHNNLGAVLRGRGDLDGAIDAFRSALLHDPEHAEAHQNLGNAYRVSGREDEAVRHYRKALARREDRVGLYLALGRTLFRTGHLAEAAAVYRQWLQREPDNPIAAHMLAACSGQAMPGRASDAFVKATFDAFAEDFDDVLGGLQYRAPGLVVDAARLALPAHGGALDVLDAGCGTGWCGPLVRPLARSLVGVDLSPAMLTRAKERGVYDRLEEAELVAFLAAHRAQFDLILAADVFVYFGALEPLLAAIARAMRPGGRAVFTTERAAAAPAGFSLLPHGRYSHAVAYVEQCSESAGLRCERVLAVDLRLEGGEPVAGSLFVLRHLT